MLRSQNLSYMLSHWCRPQVGFASYAVQEVLCITWFLITYFQDYTERTWGVLTSDTGQLLQFLWCFFPTFFQLIFNIFSTFFLLQIIINFQTKIFNFLNLFLIFVFFFNFHLFFQLFSNLFSNLFSVMTSQDALEVMRVTHWVSQCSHLLYWCDPGGWGYL